MNFALERLHNVDRTRIVLDVPNQSYPCGRGRDNKIICLSLLVSRKHCIFIRDHADLYITDFGSGNGVYINGEIQKPFHMVKLNKNDIIGLGCSNMDPSNDTLYTYKVCTIESSPLDTGEISVLSTTVLNSNTPPTISTSPAERTVGKKYGIDTDCDTEVPKKKLKDIDRNTHSSKVTLSKDKNNSNFSCNNQNSANSSATNNSVETRSPIVDIETEDDIEIIHTALTKEIKNQDYNCKSAKYLDSNNKSNFNEKMDIIIDENYKDDNGDSNKNISNRDVEEENLNSSDKTNEALNLPKNLSVVHSEDQIIILEDQITDDDEEESIGAVNMTCDTSLIKLKKIKHEPKTRFSEIDVIDLSDDEEGVFPCSQLFDIKYEDNTENGREIKQECINNDDQNIEKIGLDVDDEVIFLTDSEDEDNPWLERLSRSQLFNEDKKSDPNNAVVKGEIDLGIWDEDDILNINTSVGDKSKKSENINNNDSNSNNNLLTTELEAMNVNDVGLPNESSSKNTDDANKRKINDDAELDTELDKQTLHVVSTKQKLATKKSVTRLKRLIPVIEPLNLPVRRRIDCSKDKTQKVTEKSSSKLRKKKMSELKEKTNDNFYIKNQEHREKPHKSMADCHSPSEKKAISKDERKIILEKRKMKLKELAEEKNKLSAKSDQNIKKDRRTNTAKAKVSLKNRGDFLIIEQESSSTSLLDKSTNVPKSNNNQFKERLTDKADVLKKSSTSDVETQKSHQKDDVSKDTINSIVSSLKQSLQLDNTNAIQVPKDSKHDSKVTGDREKRGSSSKEKRSNKNVKISEQNKSTEYDPAVAQKENFSSNSVKLSCKLKRKKKVTFLEKSEIREYEIDRCNSLRKLVGKDAPIPVNKLRTSTTSAECSPKLEEFLLRIFKWNPVWLEEQRYLKSEPPIVSHCELHTMRLNYDSYKQYYKIAMPLLLLEVWCTMTKEFEMIEKNKQRATMMCSVVEKSTCTPIPSTNLFLTTLKLEVLVKKEDLSKQVHPVYGDLVYFEYVTNVHGKQTVNRIFAYVTNMYQTVITNLTHYNQDLKNYVKNPYAVIMYTLLTRPLQHDIPVNRVQRVRTVMYLRANIRMVQALQYLPQSPLLELILNPKIKEYQMPPMDEKFTCSSLVTRDNLNPKQLEAVFRVTETVLRKETKLCFIQGPPGTGKSKVIANLVTQILYGEHTNRKSLRILVCAPSNAAIDEIVLRLLDIRSKLKKKRFNMVRIGRLECMHSMTKPISVTELAKRHLAKMIQEAACSDSTEIAILKARINSLQAELASSQKVDEVKKKELRRKLMETSMRHDLLNCGKSANEFSAKERAKYQRLAENIILTGADIIACTLSSCYTNQMESIFGGYKEKISVCIVDEATQSCEAETLIPLMLGVKTLVLVGDPNQLPATILSQQAKKLGLDQSIFSRIQNVFTSQQNSPIIMLNTQYRMDYAISYWPNKYFYDGKLKSAIEFKTRFPFHSYRLLNHDFTQNDDKFSNTIEAEFVANLIFAMLMFANWESIDATISLGVLTPYNNQRTLILNKINEKISPISDNLKKKINFEVNTVDSFQGQERDVIIMSCVRSHGIGFLSDRQRLCVALTRAKHSLILCGNFNTFLKDQMWNALLSDAQSRGVLCHVDANATPAIIKQFIIK